MHRDILRLVPLRDATAARGVSRETRDEVDEVWRAWGIRATAEDRREDIRNRFKSRARETMLDYGPLAVWVFSGSRAHHLASLGLWWLALLVARASDTRPMPWAERNNRDMDQSPLMVAVVARRPVGRGPDGKVEWAHALGDREVARMVRAAVGLGADVDERTQRAWPLMTYCAKRGCLEAVKACLAAGAEVDAEGGGEEGGWFTALIYAGRGGHEMVVEALLEAAASAKVGGAGRDRTLAFVCEGQPTPGIVRRLAEAGADVNAVGLMGFTALHRAASRGNLAVLETLVDLGANVAAASNDLRTAIHEAANGEVVQWLAARGLSIQGDGFSSSPLHEACRNGRIDAVRALIELGADVDAKSWNSSTCLHAAVCCSLGGAVAAAVTRQLLSAGADANAADEDGQTPLHWVRHKACADVLLGAGADLEARDREGRTPICVLASQFRVETEVVLRLADRGADLVNTGGEPGLVERMVAELRAKRSSSPPG